MSKTGRIKCPNCECYFDVFADPEEFKPKPPKPKACGTCMNKNREPVNPDDLSQGWGPSQVFVYGETKEQGKFVTCPTCQGTGIE